MRGPLARALTRPLVLAAAASAIPLVSAVPAAADSIVVGGFPVDVSVSPWTVALSSRDRFGGTRAGQFCGAVAVDRSTVLTAAHCMADDVLGAPPHRATDLKAITGRTDLLSDRGREIAVRTVWVNPAYDPATNAGDFAVLTLAEPLSQSSVIKMAATGDPAYAPGMAATVYGWGDLTGGGDYAGSLHAASVHVLPDARCEEAYPAGSDGTYLPESMLCAGEVQGVGTPARGQRGTAGRPGTADRARVLGQRVRAGREPWRLHEGVRRPADPRGRRGSAGPHKGA